MEKVKSNNNVIYGRGIIHVGESVLRESEERRTECLNCDLGSSVLQEFVDHIHS